MDHRGPVDNRRRAFIDAVLLHVLGDADHLTPRLGGSLPNAFADGFRSASPLFAGKVLGNDHLWLEVVGFFPSEIATRDQARTESLKVARRDVVVEPDRRIACIGPSFHINEIPSVTTIFHGSKCGKADRAHARNGSDLIRNVVLDAGDHA